MNKSLLDNNYLFVPDFIDPKYANELYEEFKMDTKLYPSFFDYKDPQIPNSPSVHNYQPFVGLLCEKVTDMNRLVEDKVLPTYAYSRIYKNGDVLHPHKDRPACEISVTLNLGGDGSSWPIWFTKPNGEKVSCDLKPGQAIIYLGCISEHWREAFQGQEYGQVFLHYVRLKGRYVHHCFDQAKEKR